MGYRSNAWKSQKEKLAAREEILRDELEDASNEFESKVKLFLVTAVIGGVGAFLAYKAFKKFTGGNKEEEKQPEKKKSAAPKKEIPEPQIDVARQAADYGVKRMIIEKATLAAVNLLSNQIDKMIANKNTKAVEKKNEDSD